METADDESKTQTTRKNRVGEGCDRQTPDINESGMAGKRDICLVMQGG